MFSYKDKTGFTVSDDNLNQYLDIVSNDKLTLILRYLVLMRILIINIIF